MQICKGGKAHTEVVCLMDTSSSICHEFNIEVSRQKSVDVSSTMKGKTTWKELH